MLTLDPMPQVWGITGNLGGGKTLTAVNLAVMAMDKGYYVVSNVSLKMDVICSEFGERVRKLYQHFDFDDPTFDPFLLPTGSPRGSKGGKRVLVILDECAEWVDQYSSAKDPRIANFWSWIRHSSKRSQDVILIIQRLDYLNKVLRLLVSKWVIVDDMRVWRIPVLKMTVLPLHGYVMQRVFDRQKRLVQGPCLLHKARWGKFYNTAECLNTRGATTCYEYHSIGAASDFGPLFFALFISFLSVVCFMAFASRRPAAPSPARVRSDAFLAYPHTIPFDGKNF